MFLLVGERIPDVCRGQRDAAYGEGDAAVQPGTAEAVEVRIDRQVELAQRVVVGHGLDDASQFVQEAVARQVDVAQHGKVADQIGLEHQDQAVDEGKRAVDPAADVQVAGREQVAQVDGVIDVSIEGQRVGGEIRRDDHVADVGARGQRVHVQRQIGAEVGCSTEPRAIGQSTAESDGGWVGGRVVA